MADTTTPVAPAADDAEPLYSVGTVARRLGVAAATLRTWDRRYGLGPSQRVTGRHRRYSQADVTRLELMRRLLVDGVAAAEAARLALAGPAAADAGSAQWPEGAQQEREQPAEPEQGAAAESAAAAPSAADQRGRPQRRIGGGRVLALPGSTPQVRGLARAAMALDPGTVTDVIRESMRRHGAVWTWDALVVPVLVGIGNRYAATGGCVEVEHLLSECVIAEFRGVLHQLDEPVNSRAVLLACAEDEQHCLPLNALAAALAERGVTSRVFGARTPAGALAEAVRRTGPGVVFVWSQVPETGDPAPLAALPRTRPKPCLLVGGPGWDTDTLPTSARLVTTLPEAVQAVTAALGLERGR